MVIQKEKRVLLTPVKQSNSFKNPPKLKKITKQNKQKHKPQETLRKNSYEKAAETRKTTSGTGHRNKLLQGKPSTRCPLNSHCLCSRSHPAAPPNRRALSYLTAPDCTPNTGWGSDQRVCYRHHRPP